MIRSLLLSALALGLVPALAQADHRHSRSGLQVSVGLHFEHSIGHRPHRPVYHRPAYHRPVYHRPVYVAPPPVVYHRPVYVAPPPVICYPAPVYYHQPRRHTYYGW